MRLLFRALAALLIGAILALSLMETRLTSGFSYNAEHFVIFSAAGFCCAAGFGDKLNARTMICALILFAAGIELAQMLVPSRQASASLSDFILDAAASCLGLGIAHAASRTWASLRKR